MMTTAAGEGRFGAAFDWLGVERAWTRTRGGPDVVVGIVAQGVQLDHPLLGPNIQRDHSHLAPSSDADEIGGTHVAGIAAGRSSEVEGFSGVAPGARILPIRFTTGAGLQALDLPQAIEYAVERGACIINVAHDGDLSSPAALRAVQYAATRNALVICSASDSPGAVADEEAPNVIRVLSVGERLQPLITCAPGSADLAAPGFAHVPRWRAGGHQPHSGAGLGAAYVSGCAALLRSLNPGWGYHELREHLLTSGTPQGEVAAHCRTGNLLHVARAVLGPLELADESRPMAWSTQRDAQLHWTVRYRTSLCAQAVALYRPHGDEHWRELATARLNEHRMTIPADVLRRSSGTLRLACRGSNFHADDVELTIL